MTIPKRLKRRKGRIKTLPFPPTDKMIRSPAVAKMEAERKTASETW